MPKKSWQSTRYVNGGPDTPYPMVSVNAVPSSINVGVDYKALTFREVLTFPPTPSRWAQSLPTPTPTTPIPSRSSS